MLISILASCALFAAFVTASPTPLLDARTATTEIYMRIEGPTKTIYEKTLFATVETSLTNDEHTAKCQLTRGYMLQKSLMIFHLRQW